MKALAILLFALSASAQTVTIPACTMPEVNITVPKNGKVTIPAHTCPAVTITVPKGAQGPPGIVAGTYSVTLKLNKASCTTDANNNTTCTGATVVLTVSK